MMPPAVIGQRCRHEDHRPLRRADLGLAHDLHAVRDGLDAGVRAAAERVGAHEEHERAESAERRDRVAEVDARLVGDRPDLADVPEDRDDEQDDVRHDERHEHRRNRLHRLLDAPDVEDRQESDGHDLDRELGALDRIQPRADVVRPPTGSAPGPNHSRGTMLKMASPPEAIDIVMVST